ncbi:hypothetical protein ACET3Z_005444 [Daucus carota]
MSGSIKKSWKDILNSREEAAINEALNQIHMRSLEGKSKQRSMDDGSAKKYSEETRIKTEKAEAEDEHQSNKENIKGKEVGDLSQVDQNVNSSFDNAIEQEILVNKEELDKNSRDMLRKKNYMMILGTYKLVQ